MLKQLGYHVGSLEDVASGTAKIERDTTNVYINVRSPVVSRCLKGIHPLFSQHADEKAFL